ncbi:unnamed protein product [Triticum turgidum subsp. durum]|uniref:C2 and GRAM domain-containing protein n=1 Tax=Triticum turgidum subsp. durum TaxID=4567 RepID=A0A9R1NYC0_TRITD|nr:unnamed protein product [Triticum turgidum subsp. durum]
MRLYVCVLEARDLPAPLDGGGEGFYARVKVGRQRARTRAVELALPPAQAASAASRRHSVPPTWFTLHPKHRRKGRAADAADCGKILLTFSLYGENSDNTVIHSSPCPSSRSGTDVEIERSDCREHSGANGVVLDSARSSAVEQTSVDNSDRSIQADSDTVSEDDGLIEPGAAAAAAKSAHDSDAEPSVSDASFEEAMETMKAASSTPDMPDDLGSGVMFDHTYLVEAKDLNSLLFGPDSQFSKDLRELQGTTDYDEQPWTWKSQDPPSLTRTCRYTKGATKLMKDVKTIEEQTYLKADGKNFAIMTRVRTPEVPFGNCFEVVLLYKITHSPELSPGEESSRLTVSYNVEFLQSTLMKSMIEGSVRDGLKENFESFAEILSRHVKLADAAGMDKEQLLAPLQTDRQSHIRLAYKYFCNFTVVSTVIMAVYVLVHILLSRPGPLMGLEFSGLDLPDTFGELITSGILVLQMERLLNMVYHFVQARIQRGGDHGVKANGDGWLLTVALLEATSLPPVSCGSVDPYVVFSCNGITRTSSVQLQTQEPQWNEVMEFDAMEEPPAMLDVEIFNFDGPFDLAISLGHAEINFLKHTPTELADIWVPLEGKLAQTCQSRLHLRIFLENTKGSETSMRDYLNKMEKEVGKKLHVRSPHRNSTFQKLFSLPHEEFLIADYACSLKRKLPLQAPHHWCLC